MEGDGAFTAVDGEKAVMRPFDLVLTPGGQWHDHGNPTDKPMIWLDGLDIPTVSHFNASFSEKLGEDAHPETVQPGDTSSRYGHNLRPMRGSVADRRPAHQPLFHYPHAEWRPALDRLATSDQPDPHLGHALEFTNPADGGSIMPTISAHVRLLPQGFKTQPRRSTDASIYVVVEGSGRAWLDNESMALAPRDILIVPSWTTLRFDADETMVLFGYSDRACQEKLNLYREENA